jgi:hypothetical protein
MQDPAFSAPGRFWRGNLHTHSNVSDGALDPEEVCRRYREEGYDFIALTDHFIGQYGYPIVDTRPFRSNSFTTILGADRAEGFWHLDRLLEEGLRLTLCATDDAHFTEEDHFGGWTMVKAEDNTPDALLEALKAGHMYASTGPQIHDVIWRPEEVTISCSAAASVIVQGQGSAAVARHGHSMTRVSVPLDRFAASPWMRLTVIDRAGKRAWTNPVWKEA